MTDAAQFRQVDPDDLPPPENYRRLIAAITPRPIAWVSTISPTGITNLAPFSFFTGVTGNPPTVLFCPALDRHGNKKDTLRNVEATGQFVVNVVDFDHAAAMNQTSIPLPYGESEFEACGVPAVPSARVKPPRVAFAPVALECEVQQIVRVGEGPIAGNIVIGRVLLFHFAEAVLDANGLCDPERLDTIGRLGGDGYVRTTDRFVMPRPG